MNPPIASNSWRRSAPASTCPRRTAGAAAGVEPETHRRGPAYPAWTAWNQAPSNLSVTRETGAHCRDGRSRLRRLDRKGVSMTHWSVSEYRGQGIKNRYTDSLDHEFSVFSAFSHCSGSHLLQDDTGKRNRENESRAHTPGRRPGTCSMRRSRVPGQPCSPPRWSRASPSSSRRLPGSPGASVLLRDDRTWRACPTSQVTSQFHAPLPPSSQRAPERRPETTRKFPRRDTLHPDGAGRPRRENFARARRPSGVVGGSRRDSEAFVCRARPLTTLTSPSGEGP